MAFRTRDGETVRLVDAICWRSLEGRACLTAAERCIVAQVDVVLIPVPDGGARSKRPTEQPGTSCSSRTPQDSNAADSSTGPPTGAGVRTVLQEACSLAAAALTAAGLRAVVDTCLKTTPGAKYHTWENRGVKLRVEVGPREVSSGTYCLALHPACGHLLPAAAQAAAAAATATAASPATGGAHAAASSSNASNPDATPSSKRRATNRLGGLSLDALVAACRAVHEAPGAQPPGSPQQAAPHTCRKLHLWPAAVAAGDGVEAIAAQLRELYGLDPPGPHAAAPTLPPPAAATTGEGPATPGGAGPGERPCVAHLRHLLQLGRPCHCGRGHYSLQQLQREVEERWMGAGGAGPSGGGGGAGAGAGAGREVDGWDVPSRTAAAGFVERGTARGPSRRAGGASDGEALAPGEGGEGAQRQPAGAQRGRKRTAGGGPVDRGCGQQQVPPAGGDVDAGEAGAEGEERAGVLVGGIPPACHAGAVQAELAAALAPHGCLGVSLSRTRGGGTHGWARATLPSAAAAAAAVRALDGQLRLSCAPAAAPPLRLSFACGRADTLFPHLPYPVRRALRLDPTAAFSATDHTTAEAMTHLIAQLAEAFVLRPRNAAEQAAGSGPGAVLGAAGAGAAAAEGAVREGPAQFEGLGAAGSSGGGSGPGADAAEAARQPAAAAARDGGLLPLALTDGTACCGGNTLSFAGRFGRVTAVELDPERADDLRHNVQLARVWADVQGELTARVHHGQEQQQQQPGEQAAPEEVAAAPLAGAAAGQRGGRPAGHPHRTAPAMGALEVVCGDYTQLAWGLQQDVVFLDPPWGGPQYQGDQQPAKGGQQPAKGGQQPAGRREGQAEAEAEGEQEAAGKGRQCGGSEGEQEAQQQAGEQGTAAEPPAPLSAPAAGAAAGARGRAASSNGGVSAFTLGSTPLHQLAGGLLAGGRAALVALKLPGRAAGQDAGGDGAGTAGVEEPGVGGAAARGGGRRGAGGSSAFRKLLRRVCAEELGLAYKVLYE